MIVEEYTIGCYFKSNIFSYYLLFFFEGKMSSEKHFIDDLTRVASGALGAIGNVKGEVESKIKESIQRFLDEMDYVTTEEFEVTREIAQKVMEENLSLKEQVKSLEKKIESIIKQLDSKG